MSYYQRKIFLALRMIKELIKTQQLSWPKQLGLWMAAEQRHVCNKLVSDPIQLMTGFNLFRKCECL